MPENYGVTQIWDQFNQNGQVNYNGYTVTRGENASQFFVKQTTSGEQQTLTNWDQVLSTIGASGTGGSVA